MDASKNLYNFAVINSSNISDMNIQAKIKRQGFTIAQVAAKMKKKSGGIGISQGSLSTILNGNPTIDKLREVADIIGVSLSELVADEENTCSQGIDCPYCGKKIRISMVVERDEPRHSQMESRKTVEIRLNTDDGTKYHYKHPRTQEARMAMLELQTLPGDDGTVNVRNIIDGEVYDEDYDRLTPIK